MSDAPQDRPTPNDFARRLLQKDETGAPASDVPTDDDRDAPADHGPEKTEDAERFDAG